MLSNKKISKWLFYLFILLLPWQTRLILLQSQTEYLSFSIYLSEIVLWLALAFWLVDNYRRIKLPFCFSVFLFFCLFSIFWAGDRIAAFRVTLYIFEGMLVFLYLTNVGTGRDLSLQSKKDNFKKPAIKVFLFSLIFVSGFAIFQFFNLGSEAFKWLGLAERGAWNLGDIVVLADTGRWLRAYGPFPHPNILAGYLAVGVLLLLSFLRKQESRIITYFLAALFIFTLILTFSRSAWLALVVAGAYFLFKNMDKRAVRKFAIFSLILIAVLGYIFSPFITTRIKSAGWLEEKSHTERVTSWKQGFVVWKKFPIFGAGAGNYILGLREAKPPFVCMAIGCPRADDIVATYQPAHNIFLLVLAELGVIGFLLYLFIWRKFWKIPSARTILLLFLIIGLFDHYLWSLYSGQMLFWLGLGLLHPSVEL